MSEHDLELLITLDDPRVAPEEDIFDHLQTRKNLEYWLSQPQNKKSDIEVFTVTHWKNGQIVEQRVFCDLAGMQDQLGSGKCFGPSFPFGSLRTSRGLQQ
jgi:hypothetical protein